MVNDNILFYYPSRSLGGAQLLFVRLAKWLVMHSHYHIYMCDYKDGFIETSVQDNPQIEIINVDENEKNVVVPPHSNVIVYANEVFHINKIFQYDTTCRFLIWTVRADNITGYFGRYGSFLMSKRKRSNMGIQLKMLYEYNVLRFMDNACYDHTALFFKFSIKSQAFLQILVSNEGFEEEYRQQTVDRKCLRFAWLGRLDTDKFNSIIMALKELNGLPFAKQIRMFVIGTGDKEGSIKRYIDKYCVYPVELVGVKKGKELNDFIDANVDIGLAQGTSLLEFSKRGKPTILVEGYSKIYPCRTIKYNILDEMANYCLGEFYSKGKTIRNHYFEDAVDIILDDYNGAAIRCYEYVKKNFSVDAVGDKFLNLIEDYPQANKEVVFRSIARLEKEYNDSYYRRLFPYFYRIYKTGLGLTVSRRKSCANEDGKYNKD